MYAAYVDTLRAELESRGLRASAVYGPQPAEITPRWLATALHQALIAAQDPAFAIRYGLRLNLATHGLLGYALMSARTGEQLVSLLCRYVSLALPALVLRRRLLGDELLLEIRTTDAHPLPGQALIEVTIAALLACARTHFNNRIPGAQIALEYPRPNHAQAYRALSVPVRFAQPFSALRCHRDFLSQPLPGTHHVLAGIGAEHCETLLAAMRSRGGLAQRVRRRLLLQPGQFPRQSEMALQMGTSERSLRRHLRDEHTSYRQLLDEVRYELARGYLRGTTLTIGQVALALGYEDTANFRRAFYRWSGMSAASWRAGPGARPG